MILFYSYIYYEKDNVYLGLPDIHFTKLIITLHSFFSESASHPHLFLTF